MAFLAAGTMFGSGLELAAPMAAHHDSFFSSPSVESHHHSTLLSNPYGQDDHIAMTQKAPNDHGIVEQGGFSKPDPVINPSDKSRHEDQGPDVPNPRQPFDPSDLWNHFPDHHESLTVHNSLNLH